MIIEIVSVSADDNSVALYCECMLTEKVAGSAIGRGEFLLLCPNAAAVAYENVGRTGVNSSLVVILRHPNDDCIARNSDTLAESDIARPSIQC